jgi:hypothetical protein
VPFDLKTAKPVKSGFDLSTAKPVTDTSEQVQEAPQEKPTGIVPAFQEAMNAPVQQYLRGGKEITSGRLAPMAAGVQNVIQGMTGLAFSPLSVAQKEVEQVPVVGKPLSNLATNIFNLPAAAYKTVAGRIQSGLSAIGLTPERERNALSALANVFGQSNVTPEEYQNLARTTTESGALGTQLLAGMLAGKIVGYMAKEYRPSTPMEVAQAKALKEYGKGEEAKQLASRISQVKTKEQVPQAQRVLVGTDLSKTRTYEGAKNVIQNRITNISNKLDEALAKDKRAMPLQDLSSSIDVEGKTYTHNFVQDALSQMWDFYKKTNNVQGAAKIRSWMDKANTAGLTIKDVNDIAKQHGRDLNAFNANGELSSGLSKQAAENTRQGVKDIARTKFNNPIYNEADATLSDLITTRDAMSKMAGDVFNAKKRLPQLGLAGKTLNLGIKALDFISRHAIGKLQQILGKQTSTGSMTKIAIEEALQNNLKKFNDLVGSKIPKEQMEQRLNDFINNTEQEFPIDFSQKPPTEEATATVVEPKQLPPAPPSSGGSAPTGGSPTDQPKGGMTPTPGLGNLPPLNPETGNPAEGGVEPVKPTTTPSSGSQMPVGEQTPATPTTASKGMSDPVLDRISQNMPKESDKAQEYLLALADKKIITIRQAADILDKSQSQIKETPLEQPPQTGENPKISQPIPEPVPSVQPSVEMAAAPDYTAQAKESGVTFNGMQDMGKGKSLPMFTDPQTKTSFLQQEGETLEQALNRKREQFEQPVQPTGASEQSALPEFKTREEVIKFAKDNPDRVKELEARRDQNLAESNKILKTDKAKALKLSAQAQIDDEGANLGNVETMKTSGKEPWEIEKSEQKELSKNLAVGDEKFYQFGKVKVVDQSKLFPNEYTRIKKETGETIDVPTQSLKDITPENDSIAKIVQSVKIDIEPLKEDIAKKAFNSSIPIATIKDGFLLTDGESIFTAKNDHEGNKESVWSHNQSWLVREYKKVQPQLPSWVDRNILMQVLRLPELGDRGAILPISKGKEGRYYTTHNMHTGGNWYAGSERDALIEAKLKMTPLTDIKYDEVKLIFDNGESRFTGKPIQLWDDGKISKFDSNENKAWKADRPNTIELVKYAVDSPSSPWRKNKAWQALLDEDIKKISPFKTVYEYGEKGYGDGLTIEVALADNKYKLLKVTTTFVGEDADVSTELYLFKKNDFSETSIKSLIDKRIGKPSFESLGAIEKDMPAETPNKVKAGRGRNRSIEEIDKDLDNAYVQKNLPENNSTKVFEGRLVTIDLNSELRKQGEKKWNDLVEEKAVIKDLQKKAEPYSEDLNKASEEPKKKSLGKNRLNLPED